MKLVKVLPIVMIICVIFTSVFAVKLPALDSDLTYGQSGSTEAINTAKNIWSTAIVIIQILSVAAVVFAGLRYMFASADQRADIKKSLGILIIGAVLVFGATLVLEFIVDSSLEILS